MERESFLPTQGRFLSTDLRPMFPLIASLSGSPELIVDLREPQIDAREETEDERFVTVRHEEVPNIGSVAPGIREIEALHMLSNGLAHDLNNLFQVATSALSLIELRAKLGRDADIPGLIEKASLALNRAQSVIHRLIQLPVHPSDRAEEVDVNATITSLRDLFSVLAGSDIDVSLALSLRRPLIFCDILDFENALLNLVTNSKNAISDEGRITIKTSVELLPSLSMSPRTDDSHYVVITVSDSGHGMSEAVATRAFDAFYSTRASNGGTGLGLAMVRRFLSDVSGRSKIESTVGSGTSISLIIPMVQRKTPRDI
ncbi:sensor histidine kinase [Tardiphaga sp. 862_B3_N4_1]|uniref:sensor histidine kinase n=1 Tax=Tardiphaga sp. 862_B3_N4_1 TaxID=3240764 RepID=UPI003F294811